MQKIDEENMFMVMVLKNCRQVIETKTKKLKLWKKTGIYEEVEDVGQACISTCWVVTQNVVVNINSLKYIDIIQIII